MIRGLAGVILHTDRFPVLRAFYLEVLELVPRSDRPGFLNVDWEGVRLTITSHSEVSGPARDPHRVLLNLRVDDIHEAHRRLVARGVGFVRPPEREAWGGWVATFPDPDGNLLQLLQLP